MRVLKGLSKEGDLGYASLLGGQRVPKFDLRPEAYGTIDEASSALGLARALSRDAVVKEIIYSVQKELFIVGAEIATALEDYAGTSQKIRKHHTERLEHIIDELLERQPAPTEFIVPGGSVVSAVLDLARTIVRRAERKVHKLRHRKEIQSEELGRYLNRLSDLLFMLARVEEKSTVRALAKAKRKTKGTIDWVYTGK